MSHDWSHDWSHDCGKTGKLGGEKKQHDFRNRVEATCPTPPCPTPLPSCRARSATSQPTIYARSASWRAIAHGAARRRTGPVTRSVVSGPRRPRLLLRQLLPSLLRRRMNVPSVLSPPSAGASSARRPGTAAVRARSRRGQSIGLSVELLMPPISPPSVRRPSAASAAPTRHVWLSTRIESAPAS